MLTASRRAFFGGVLGMLVAACGRVPPPLSRPVAPTSTPELDAWRAQAYAMMKDSLSTLRTLEVFAAYRVAAAGESAQRPSASLAWDPPTGAAWDEATRHARGLHGRVDQLIQGITTSAIDADLWREQRMLADQVHDLLDVGDALRAYRDRLDRLPPDDAAETWGLLDRAWLRWDSAAARFGLSRSELIGCGG